MDDLTENSSLVAYTSLAFGIVALIASACCKDVESRMTNNIEVFITGEEEKAGALAHNTLEMMEMEV